MSPINTHPPINNLLLSALPRDEYARLASAFQPVRLLRGVVLYEIGSAIRYAYFLTSGMVSLLSMTKDGKTVEVGMIGDEGLVGVPIILGMSTAPYRITVQIPTTAVRVKAALLRDEFNRGGALQNVLLKYSHMLIVQLSQSALCNRFHTSEERLCRWLLISRDRTRSNTLNLTQDAISQMLGVPRTGVTLTAGVLQKRGLIRYSRGRIIITDPRSLETAACECYGIVREEFEHFLAA